MSIKHSLLALLQEESRSAAQLRHAFEHDMDGFYSLNMGQVTQTLARLERDGLIFIDGQTISSNGRHADLFTITEAGASELAAWWNQAFTKPATDRDELVIKMALAARRDGTSGLNLVALLDKQRFATLKELRVLNSEADDLPASRTAQRLSLERRVFDLEAQLRWLDRVESLAAPDLPTTEQEDSHNV